MTSITHRLAVSPPSPRMRSSLYKSFNALHISSCIGFSRKREQCLALGEDPLMKNCDFSRVTLTEPEWKSKVIRLLYSCGIWSLKRYSNGVAEWSCRDPECRNISHYYSTAKLWNIASSRNSKRSRSNAYTLFSPLNFLQGIIIIFLSSWVLLMKLGILDHCKYAMLINVKGRDERVQGYYGINQNVEWVNGGCSLKQYFGLNVTRYVDYDKWRRNHVLVTN